MHEIREDSGTARPIQRKLTSQLQSETESAEDRAKHLEHLDLSADLTKLLLPVLLEVSCKTCLHLEILKTGFLLQFYLKVSLPE